MKRIASKKIQKTKLNGFDEWRKNLPSWKEYREKRTKEMGTIWKERVEMAKKELLNLRGGVGN